MVTFEFCPIKFCTLVYCILLLLKIGLRFCINHWFSFVCVNFAWNNGPLNATIILHHFDVDFLLKAHIFANNNGNNLLE